MERSHLGPTWIEWENRWPLGHIRLGIWLEELGTKAPGKTTEEPRNVIASIRSKGFDPYDDKYCTAVANNVQDARKLLETGFEYVCSHKDEMLFRKRKQETRASNKHNFNVVEYLGLWKFFPRFRYSYPSWSPIHVFTICNSILLYKEGFLNNHYIPA